MEAFFEEEKYPKVRLVVGGSKKKQTLTAILDTGFDGFLSLPISIAVQLGIELRDVMLVQYADGRTNTELVFNVYVELDDKGQTVPATLTNSTEVLAGTSLFSNRIVTFDFQKLTIDISL